MTSALKMAIYKGPLYDILRPLKYGKDFLMWHCHRQAPPLPAFVKQSIVIEYGNRFGLNTMIETGTYLGDMVFAIRKHFTTITSIELNPDLHEIAARRFAKFHHMYFRCGDSAAVLPDLLATLSEPCLFWLDAHYSGGVTQRGALESPIARECDLILRHHIAGHVVLIDDARNFSGRSSYPTMGALRALVMTLQPNWCCDVADDIIRLHAKP